MCAVLIDDLVNTACIKHYSFLASASAYHYRGWFHQPCSDAGPFQDLNLTQAHGLKLKLTSSAYTTNQPINEPSIDKQSLLKYGFESEFSVSQDM